MLFTRFRLDRVHTEVSSCCDALLLVVTARMTIPNNPACPFGRTRDATNLCALIRRCTFLRPRHWFSLDNKLNPQVVMDMRTTTGSGLLHANY